MKDNIYDQFDNKFDLILVAAKRARELQHGDYPRVSGSHNPAVTALKEIDEGKYTKTEYLLKLQENTNETQSSKSKRYSNFNPRDDQID